MNGMNKKGWGGKDEDADFQPENKLEPCNMLAYHMHTHKHTDIHVHAFTFVFRAPDFRASAREPQQRACVLRSTFPTL